MWNAWHYFPFSRFLFPEWNIFFQIDTSQNFHGQNWDTTKSEYTVVLLKSAQLGGYKSHNPFRAALGISKSDSNFCRNKSKKYLKKKKNWCHPWLGTFLCYRAKSQRGYFFYKCIFIYFLLFLFSFSKFESALKEFFFFYNTKICVFVKQIHSHLFVFMSCDCCLCIINVKQGHYTMPIRGFFYNNE